MPAGYFHYLDKEHSPEVCKPNYRKEDDEPEAPSSKPNEQKVAGLVANDYGTAEKTDDEPTDGDGEEVPHNFSNSWKLNFVLATVSCWFAMALTGWGSISSGGDVADPLVGKTSMWIIVCTQWFALLLYLWTLVAPRMFPDRDFS